MSASSIPAPVADRVLRVPELARIVALQCITYPRVWPGAGDKDLGGLTSLALASKAIYYQVIDVVWEELTSLRPLVYILPRDAFRVLTLSRRRGEEILAVSLGTEVLG